jgi:dienelactone hydrolase
VSAVSRAEYSEELVWIESEDGIRLDGVVIRPAARGSRPVVVVHVHGFTGRFSHPAHVLVGRGLARHGVTSVSGNNRGWAFGETTQRRAGPVVIGSGWERFEECPLDVGAWVSFAAGLGFEAVVLLGHSFGAPKAVYYQAVRQDPRVRALVLASPGRARLPEIDPGVLAQAERLVAEGRGTDLLPWGSFRDGALSAQTLLDHARLDPFGVRSAEAPVGRVRCPILAFYGSEEPAVGTPVELELIRRNAAAAARVDTRMVAGADHSYAGRGPEVADLIAEWLDSLP